MNRLHHLARRAVTALARVPWAFDGLRYVLEGGHRAHRRLIADFVARVPGRVLDCGCGTGIYAREFSSARYVGVDLSPAYIDRARESFSDYDFRVMDATRMDFPDESFDAAIVSGVLHHLDDGCAGRVLGELERVLRPEGRLLVWEDVPAKSSWNIVGHLVHRLDVGQHIRQGESYRHLLAPHFHVERTWAFRSGFMDYGVFHCVKPSRLSSLLSDSQLMGTPPLETDSSHDLAATC
jgi:ubiquinone/menaquinone biosynthesis C-methylase UbiE